MIGVINLLLKKLNGEQLKRVYEFIVGILNQN